MMKEAIPDRYGKCLGYHYDRKCREYTVVAEEAAIVSLIFQMFLDGYSIGLIRRVLKLRDCRKRNGRDLDLKSIRGILKNESYTGDLLMRKLSPKSMPMKSRPRKSQDDETYLIHDHHEAIISHSDFQEAQAELEERQKLQKFLKKDKVTLFPRIECAWCHTALKRKRIHNSYQPPYFLLKCGRKINGTAADCPESKAVHEDVIEMAFMRGFNDLLSHRPQLIISVLETTDCMLAGVDTKRLRERNTAALGKLREMRTSLEALRSSDKIPMHVFEERYREILLRERDLQKVIRILEDTDSLIAVCRRRIRQFISMPQEERLMQEFDPLLLGLLIEKVIVGGENDPFLLTFLMRGSNTEGEAEILLECTIRYRHHFIRKSSESTGIKEIRNYTGVRFCRKRPDI